MQAHKFNTVTTSSVRWPKKEGSAFLKHMISTLRSDWEAAGLFLTDEGLLSEKEEVNKLKKLWGNQMGILRRMWSKL